MLIFSGSFISQMRKRAEGLACACTSLAKPGLKSRSLLFYPISFLNIVMCFTQ